MDLFFGSLVMSSTTSPRVLVEMVGGVTVASFADGELIAEQIIEEVGEQLSGLADSLEVGRVVLNFREVRLMSSSMLATLLKFSRKVTAANGRLKMCCIAPHLREIFKITRFDKIFEIFDEESAALDSFK
jgi:anti-sigma B factor antagonist